jgi:hypothetical protein
MVLHEVGVADAISDGLKTGVAEVSAPVVVLSGVGLGHPGESVKKAKLARPASR